MKIIKRSIFLLLFILSTTINCFSQQNYWLISWLGSSPEEIIGMIAEENYEMYDVKKEKITFIYGDEELRIRVSCYFKNKILYKVECDNRFGGEYTAKEGEFSPFWIRFASKDIKKWESRFFKLANYKVYKWENIERTFKPQRRTANVYGKTKVLTDWLDKNGKTYLDYGLEGYIGLSRFLSKPGIEVEILKNSAEGFFTTVITAQ